MPETTDDDISIVVAATTFVELPSMSKSARKRLLKQQRLDARKKERKEAEKERRRQDLQRRRSEWETKLASVSEEERTQFVESRKEIRRERMAKRTDDRVKRAERLRRAAVLGQKIVLDLGFSDLMTSSEIQSVAHQIMYCYAVNGKCESPADLWLTGCKGEVGAQLQKIPGYENWIIQKEDRSYIEAFKEHKERLVYLTADAETTLEELDASRIYIIGGLVDRNRWKGVTLKKANEQGIQSARLPIGNYLKLASSQVLTVNQVFEILLKFVQTRDWRKAFFDVIPQRKRGAFETQGNDSIYVENIERACNEGLEAEFIQGNGVANGEVDDDVVRSKKHRSELNTFDTNSITAGQSTETSDEDEA